LTNWKKVCQNSNHSWEMWKRFSMLTVGIVLNIVYYSFAVLINVYNVTWICIVNFNYNFFYIHVLRQRLRAGYVYTSLQFLLRFLMRFSPSDACEVWTGRWVIIVLSICTLLWAFIFYNSFTRSHPSEEENRIENRSKYCKSI
jgi:hypothetical protein